MSKVKPFLSLNDLEKVIYAFISSRLNYCDLLLINGVNKSSLNRLQVIQNAAARLLADTTIYLLYSPHFTGSQSGLELILT